MGLNFRDTYHPAADGVTDDSTKLQRFFDDAVADGITELNLQGGVYRINTSVRLPNVTTSTNVRRYVLNGGGAVLISGGTGVNCLERTMSDVSDSTLYWNPTIRDITFTTASVGNGKGVYIEGTQQLNISQCACYDLDTGIELVFALMPIVEGCSCRDVINAFAVKSGDGIIPNAGVSNGNPNQTQLIGCRAYLSNASAVGFLLRQALGFRLVNCVAEGSLGNYGFYCNDETAGGRLNRTSFLLDNCYNETAAISAQYRIDIRRGIVHIDGAVSAAAPDAANSYAIDARQTTDSVIRVSNSAGWYLFADNTNPFLYDDASTATTANKWVFHDNILSEGQSFVDSTNWDGTRPDSALIDEKSYIYE